MSKKRITELIKLINEANYNYYTLDNPTISDQEYDRYMIELIELEKKYPKYVSDTSPTKRVGGQVISSFQKVSHQVPMLSLSNAFNNEDITSFDLNIKKQISNLEYVLEPKIDGLAVSLVYEEGILKQGLTRGDGSIGEDITHNIKTVKSIPLVLKEKINITVRGEVYMSKDVFKELNEIRKLNNEKLLINPRNAAAGSVRQLDSKIAASRKLSCFVYSVDGLSFKTHYESLKYLKELGFLVNSKIKKVSLVSEIVNYIEDLDEKRNFLNYEIDGVVIKVNKIADQIILGYTSRYPKWAIAYKFPAIEVTTRIKDIIFTVGRTGKITPNAILEPVLVDGSMVSKATLHNEDYINERDIRINDIVIIRKAGDIIPEVVKVIKTRREETNHFEMINKCPICKTSLKKINSMAYCVNENCDARKQENLIHFVSRGAMNIENLGERIIEDFYNLGYLKTIVDFYKLKNYKEELMKLEGFGEKSINKILDNIEKTKFNSLEKLIFALGIRHVGLKTSKQLASHFKNMDNLLKAEYEELINIRDVGEVIAKSVIEFFNKNKDLITKLKQYNLNFNYIDNIVKSNYKDKRFVLTGTLKSIKRSEAIVKIEQCGGMVTNSVSKNTDFVIVGENPGSKYDKAKELNISIWTEKDFINNI